jgi:hypothetical protein
LVTSEGRLDRLPGLLQVRGPGVQVGCGIGWQRVALAAQDVGDVRPQGHARIVAKESLMRRLAGGRIDRCVEAEGEGRQEALPVGDLGVGVEDGGAEVFGRVPVSTFNLQVTTWVKWASESMVNAQRRPEAALQVVVELAAVVRDYNLRDAENGDPVPPDGFGNLRRGFLGHRR